MKIYITYDDRSIACYHASAVSLADSDSHVGMMVVRDADGVHDITLAHVKKIEVERGETT